MPHSAKRPDFFDAYVPHIRTPNDVAFLFDEGIDLQSEDTVNALLKVLDGHEEPELERRLVECAREGGLLNERPPVAMIA